ncbi:glycosyltransferase [Intestinibacter bartlettii]|uniref:Glycosyltransferase n=1 Tax=Intestinibacter bartlettii TaxID=261299 RepID=A0ABS6DZQ1_9FIRM|nr:glycosyltransferase [Intestinibacter bartlettii]MBU5337314.1 glycosyltransferase [Intestinibacter bartlettii]
MQEIISVIVPIYKVEEYLERCINSILNQTYKNLEIILVNDGSPDKCPNICEEYAKKDDRIKVIHKQNGGLSDARNYGLNIAIGKYISFVDSDDYIEKNMYQDMINELRMKKADIVSCAINNVYSDRSVSSDIEERVYDTESALKDLILGKNLNQTVWNKLYKKDVINGILFEKGKINEDDFWTYQVFANSKKIITLNKVLYNYIHRESSIMGQGYSEKNLNGLEARYNQYKFIEKNYPKLNLIAKKSVFFYAIFLYQKLLISKHDINNSYMCIQEYLKEINFNDKERKQLTIKEKIWVFMGKKSMYFTCKIRNLIHIGI